MLSLFVNGTHIGLLHLPYAYQMAERMCDKLGDVVALYTVDPYDHVAEQCVKVYHKNSQGVQVYDYCHELDFYPIMWDKVEEEPTTNFKVRDKMYAKVRTERTYGEADHKHSNRKGSRSYMSFIKRQERRSARKLSKSLIQEQMV